MKVNPVLKNVVALALAIALAFLFVLAPSHARDTRIAPALWKIDGAKGDIYLFGSFHILPRDFQWRTPELEAALQAAQQLDFEIDLDEAQNPTKLGDLIQRFGILPPDQSLHRMLAVEYRATLDETLKELGLPPLAVDRMRPWLAALTITSLTAMKQSRTPGQKVDPAAATGEQGGADIQLWNWAKSSNRQRGALETLESQIHIFSDLSHDQEVQYLIVTLQQTGKMSETLDGLINAWKSGDTKKLDKALNGDMDNFPAMRKALFSDRHEKWLPQIEAMMNDGKTHVVIVGAAHLVGQGSVVDLLRAKGIKVEGP
ncbi:MAG: TraB/GumN family protein [Micropepsaceae bacterium]